MILIKDKNSLIFAERRQIMGRPGTVVARLIHLAFTLGSAAVLCYGLLLKSRERNASSDFETLPSKCAITAVFHTTSSESRYSHMSKQSTMVCYDEYVYQFAWCDGISCSPAAAPTAIGDVTGRGAGYAPQGDGWTETQLYREWWDPFPSSTFRYTGWETTLLLSASHGLDQIDCSSTEPVNVGFRAGEWVTCYRPMSGYTPTAPYRCGVDNVPCIKILQPQNDLAATAEASMEVVYFGAGATLFFLFLWLCSYWGVDWDCQELWCGEDDSDSEDSSSTKV